MGIFTTPDEAYNIIKTKGYKALNGKRASMHFFWSEMFVNQTEKPSLNVCRNVFKVILKLEEYRKNLFNERPIYISSGWRSKAYNKKIKGSKGSYHIKGLAVDFFVHNMLSTTARKILDKVHFGGMEYNTPHIHFDLRPYNARFNP